MQSGGDGDYEKVDQESPDDTEEAAAEQEFPDEKNEEAPEAPLVLETSEAKPRFRGTVGGRMFAGVNLARRSSGMEGVEDKAPATSMAVKCMRLLLFFLTFGCYSVGFLALIYYSYKVEMYSSHLDFDHTMVPVILHVIGIGTSIVIKSYYDMSPKVGHVESMHIIIRSRMWLFPGVLGAEQLNRRKRSAVEAERRQQEERLEEERQLQPGYQPEDPSDLKFGMAQFLRKCQFPEFRCLFRAIDMYPWASISSLDNLDLADELTRMSQAQVMRIFPMLDFLDIFSNVPSMINPLNHKRYIGNFLQYYRGKRSPAHVSSFEKDEVVTRYEEVEQDDVTSNLDEDWFNRHEARPWGTLRLNNFEEKFFAMTSSVNLMSVLVFSFMISGYFILIFGEMNFYTVLRAAHTDFLELHGNLYGVVNETLAQDDDNSWAEDKEGLLGFQATATILLFSLIPFAVQASALIAENAAVPLLVMDTMKCHVENFKLELDQYLTILAVHKGTLAAPDSSLTGTGAQAGKKVAMTRDMALWWRIKMFVSEIEHDSAIINSGVVLMVLNIICHLVPLNLFMFHSVANETDLCIPSWLIYFTAAQFFGLMSIINRGIQCNELTEQGVDALLHDWQLKFNMIGWSGGFIGPATDNSKDFDVFVPRNPVGERFEDIEEQEAAGNSTYGVKIQAEQQHRLASIVKVLAHYEAETITPLKVVGITVTRDIMTLIFGFFGAQIIAFATQLMDRSMDGSVEQTFMCHVRAFHGINGNPEEVDEELFDSFQEAFLDTMNEEAAAIRF